MAINLKGCLWALDDLGNLLMRHSITAEKKIGKGWNIVKSIKDSFGFKDLTLNERDLWLISLDGDPFILPEICF